jgi:beta-glucosidase-like glycosyl hydrolase
MISDALNMHSVSKLFDKKEAVEWEAFNAGNDVLCFAENVPDGIQEILKTQILSALKPAIPLMKCKHKVGILGGNHIVGKN